MQAICGYDGTVFNLHFGYGADADAFNAAASIPMALMSRAFYLSITYSRRCWLENCSIFYSVGVRIIEGGVILGDSAYRPSAFLLKKFYNAVTVLEKRWNKNFCSTRVVCITGRMRIMIAPTQNTSTTHTGS